MMAVIVASHLVYCIYKFLYTYCSLMHVRVLLLNGCTTAPTFKELYECQLCTSSSEIEQPLVEEHYGRFCSESKMHLCQLHY